MSLRKKLCQLQTKPIQVFMRCTGALLVEFGDPELKRVGRAFKSQKALDSMALFCKEGVSPALTVEEYRRNKKLGEDFIAVLDHQLKREERYESA